MRKFQPRFVYLFLVLLFAVGVLSAQTPPPAADRPYVSPTIAAKKPVAVPRSR
jgi:hypothetical protein